MGEWISVKDRLPDMYNFVLVYAKICGTNEPCPTYIARYDGNKWRLLGEDEIVAIGAFMHMEYDLDVDDITHWMPLPEAPK